MLENRLLVNRELFHAESTRQHRESSELSERLGHEGSVLVGAFLTYVPMTIRDHVERVALWIGLKVPAAEILRIDVSAEARSINPAA